MAPVYGLAECAVALALPPPGANRSSDRVKREALSRRELPNLQSADDANAVEVVDCGHTRCLAMKFVLSSGAGREVEGAARGPARVSRSIRDLWLFPQ